MNTKKRWELIKKVFNGYGSKCNCCAIDDFRFLTIDHVNNDGKLERSKGNKNSYRRVIKEGFPREFQILCYNCNLGKARNKGICPHKTPKDSHPIYNHSDNNTLITQ